MTAPSTDLDLNGARAVLDHLARSLAPAIKPRALSDHLILASRGAVEAKYGPSAFRTLDAALGELARVSGGSLLYVDDPVSAATVGVEPLDQTTRAAAWAAWLDNVAPTASSVLLVGGPDLVPFGVARNPSDDDDGPLATDAPLAGGRPLEPQRAVGRLPDGGDISYLVRLVRATTEAHAATRAPRWAARLRIETPTAIGYTASIWRNAARVVYGAIDSPQRLRMSPPLDHTAAPAITAQAFSPAYFNLHGLKDDAGWYGQRDPLLAADYAAFPLALSPDQLVPAPQRRLVAFSAACYGAHIEDKGAANSMALRLLDTHAAAFVGSTAVAYGGLAEPLQATDQLALLFWQRLRGGLPVGEALRQAKLGLIEEMQRRQGYIDAEDQKAVLSFVLYGDPSLRPFRASSGDSPAAVASAAPAPDRPSGPSLSFGAPAIEPTAETLRRVECDVRARLPDLGPVRIQVAPRLHRKGSGPVGPMLTLTVVEAAAHRPFRHLVRVTLNADGAIAKLVMAHG